MQDDFHIFMLFLKNNWKRLAALFDELSRKIVFFRNNDRVKDSEWWHIGNDVWEIVNQFTYLGILFNFNNKFTKAEKQLSEHGRKALFALTKNIRGMFYWRNC